jgi:hypothetical protein
MIEKRLIQWFAADAGVDLDIAEREVALTCQRQLDLPMATIRNAHDGCVSLLPPEPSRCAENAAKTSTVKGGFSGFPP